MCIIVVEVPVLGRHSVITKRSLAGSCAQRLEKEKREKEKDSAAILGQLLQGTAIILFVKQNSARMVFMASLSMPNSPILVTQGELVTIFLEAWRGYFLIWTNC